MHRIYFHKKVSVAWIVQSICSHFDQCWLSSYINQHQESLFLFANIWNFLSMFLYVCLCFCMSVYLCMCLSLYVCLSLVFVWTPIYLSASLLLSNNLSIHPPIYSSIHLTSYLPNDSWFTFAINHRQRGFSNFF